MLITYDTYRFKPPPLKIQLSIGAGFNKSYLTGTYLQVTGLINEKPFWLQQNGSHAIWYSYSDWIIGDMIHLGKFHGKIFVNVDQNDIYPNASLPITFMDTSMYENKRKCNQISYLLLDKVFIF